METYCSHCGKKVNPIMTSKQRHLYILLLVCFIFPGILYKNSVKKTMCPICSYDAFTGTLLEEPNASKTSKDVSSNTSREKGSLLDELINDKLDTMKRSGKISDRDFDRLRSRS